jgi:hypothetical protein
MFYELVDLCLHIRKGKRGQPKTVERKSAENQLSYHLDRLERAKIITVDRTIFPYQYDFHPLMQDANSPFRFKIMPFPALLRETRNYLGTYHPNPRLLDPLEKALNEWNKKSRNHLDRYIV